MLLGESAVYPGHYTTLAYLISQNFECWEDARQPTPFNASEAVGSLAIPGSGANVSTAMDYMHYIRDGLMSIEDFFSWADEAWLKEALDETAHIKGYDQASRCEEWLRSNLKEWLLQPSRLIPG
jgi:hypothetical protein